MPELSLSRIPNTNKTCKNKINNNNKTSRLFDSELFTKNLEFAYKTIYKNYHLDLPNEDVYIS